MASHYLHGIRLDGRKSKYSAYFQTVTRDSKPECSLTYLDDCERIDAKGRSFRCTEKERDALWHYRHQARPYVNRA